MTSECLRECGELNDIPCRTGRGSAEMLSIELFYFLCTYKSKFWTVTFIMEIK